jgi:hypothetical protein
MEGSELWDGDVVDVEVGQKERRRKMHADFRVIDFISFGCL